jgi:hypothetical protein
VEETNLVPLVALGGRGYRAEVGLVGWNGAFGPGGLGIDSCLLNLYVSSIDLSKCVWRRLAARLMRLGGWKGVERLASPCRLKNIEHSNLFGLKRYSVVYGCIQLCILYLVLVLRIVSPIMILDIFQKCTSFLLSSY